MNDRFQGLQGVATRVAVSIIWCCLAASPFLSAQQPQSAHNGMAPDSIPPKQTRELRADLGEILSDSALANASFGVYVYSPKNKEILFSRNEQKAFVPASSLKLFTTAAALEYLGEDFTFTTSVFLDGIIKSSGEYIGNVIIRGAGDPSMSAFFMSDPLAVLKRWREAFDSLGIKSIRGYIIGDNSYFDDDPLGVGWAWDDIPYPFSAEISALSFNDNKVELTVRSGARTGDPVDVAMSPPTAYVTVMNRAETVPADSARKIDFTRDLSANIVELKGRMPLDTSAAEKRAKTSFSVATHNPTLLMLNLFKQILKEGGIAVSGEVFDVRQWGSKKISYTDLRAVAHHTSPPLSEIIRVVNTFSHNLCAEMLLRTVGKETSGTGSAEKGIQAVKEFCKQRGFPLDGAYLIDGSGLSRLNLLAAKHLGTLLSVMYNSKNRSAFTKSLGTPTERGTLFGRMKNSLAERATRAKTGTLNGVSALAGYVTTRDQETLAVVLLFNNFTVPQSDIRRIQDFICMRLASFTRK